MATVTKPIALDESFNTTELTPRNIADVLAQELSRITGRNASQVEYDNTESGLTADNVQEALDEIVEDIPTVPSVDIQTAVDEFETYNGGLLSSLKVALSPNQDLHGYDSPWVGGAGKNKIGANGGWNGSGVLEPSARAIRSEQIAVNEGDKFIASKAETFNATYANLQVLEFDSSKAFIRQTSILAYSALNGTAFTVPSGTSYVAFSVYFNSTDEVNIDAKKVQVEKGDSITTFAPYTNICPISGHTQVDVDVSDGDTTQEQVTVNLGGTYYSGILDVVTGVFTPDTASDDLGSLTWQTRYTGSVNKTLSSSLSQKPVWSATEGEAQCEDYKYNGKIGGASMLSDPDNCEVGLYQYYSQGQEGNAKVCYLVIPVDNSPDGKVVYELNDTTPIQLSPTMVKALVGENHLSAPLDGQEITESEYRELFTWDEVEAYVNAHSGGGSGMNYSTEEQVVGTWIDGKPLYQKTIDCDALPNNTAKNITTPSNLKYLVNAYGFAYSPADITYQRLVPFSAGGTNDIRVDLESGNVRVVTYSNWSSYNAFLTLQYTKTTD